MIGTMDTAMFSHDGHGDVPIDAEVAAAQTIQRCARRIWARRELEYKRRARRLLWLCSKMEARAAEVVQRHMKRRRMLREEQAAAAALAAAERAAERHPIPRNERRNDAPYHKRAAA